MNSADGAAYQFRFDPGAAEAMLFRLKMIGFDGKSELSKLVSLDRRGTASGATFPVSIENNLLVANIAEGFDVLEIVATDGRLLFSENISGLAGRVEFPIDGVPVGPCFVRLRGQFKEATQPVMAR